MDRTGYLQLNSASYYTACTQVLKAAVVQVWRAVDFCCQYLEREVSEENYLYLQELALLYSLERLDAFIDHFILTHFATLSFTPDFIRDIPLHKLTSYLSSGQVNTRALFDRKLLLTVETAVNNTTPPQHKIEIHIMFGGKGLDVDPRN